MRLDLRSVPGTARLLQDYVHDFSRLAPFFTADPQDSQAYHEHARKLDRRAYSRQDLCDLLTAQNAAWGASALSHQHIDALRHPRALAVVTGQQTGLFGGPLFTLYKALTGVQLALQLQEALGRPVVPIFWMASEDHDVAEADHVQLLDAAGNLVSIRHASWGSPGFIPANLVLGPAIQRTLQQVWDLLPPTNFTPELQAALAQAYEPGRTLAEAFARWMVFLLGESGLILVDAADPHLKRLAAPIFQREVEEAPRSSREILEQSDALRALGYAAQIEARPDGVNCFLLQEGRRSLTREAAGFRLRDGGELLPAIRLQTLARERPESLSPNVALRPILQDYLFPTLAYVAGPGELAYFAQLRPVYQAFDVPMPLIVPRASFTLVDSHAARLLDRYGLSLAGMFGGTDALRERIARKLIPPLLGRRLEETAAGTKALAERLCTDLVSFDPTLAEAMERSRRKILYQLAKIERKASREMLRRDQRAVEETAYLCQMLYPDKHLQERFYSILPFLAQHGLGLIDTIYENVRLDSLDHQLLPI